jgi:hypothetical protein
MVRAHGVAQLHILERSQPTARVLLSSASVLGHDVAFVGSFIQCDAGRRLCRPSLSAKACSLALLGVNTPGRRNTTSACKRIVQGAWRPWIQRAVPRAHRRSLVRNHAHCCAIGSGDAIMRRPNRSGSSPRRDAWPSRARSVWFSAGFDLSRDSGCGCRLGSCLLGRRLPWGRLPRRDLPAGLLLG